MLHIDQSTSLKAVSARENGILEQFTILMKQRERFNMVHAEILKEQNSTGTDRVGSILDKAMKEISRTYLRVVITV